MRTEHNCVCPKCGYNFIDVKEGYFDKEDIKRVEAFEEKYRKIGRFCEQHLIAKKKKMDCPLCIKEKKMNSEEKVEALKRLRKNMDEVIKEFDEYCEKFMYV